MADIAQLRREFGAQAITLENTVNLIERVTGQDEFGVMGNAALLAKIDQLEARISALEAERDRQ